MWSVADLPIPARILTDQIADIAAFAEAERSAILQRMDYGVRLAAERGKWLGGPVPFGYDLDAKGALTPSGRQVAGMAEADLARSVFEALAAGSSTVKEARRMNELGVFPGRRYSNKVVRMKRSTWFPHGSTRWSETLSIRAFIASRNVPERSSAESRRSSALTYGRQHKMRFAPTAAANLAVHRGRTFFEV